MYSEEIKELVIKLRSKLSLSLNEITELTDIPKSTLSGWLKDYKLPNDNDPNININPNFLAISLLYRETSLSV